MSRLTKAQQIDQDEAIEQLRAILPPGSKLYTKVTHVARSGMQRSIEVYHVDGGDICRCTYLVARALGYRIDQKNGGIVMGGLGMDMGFHLVMNLSYALHGMKAVGEEAQEASAKGRPFTPKPDNYRAGYSLRQEWI